MKRTALLASAAGAVLALSVGSSALASNVHFKSGSVPTFKDNGLTLTSTGSLTGLGNSDVTVNLTADGQPIATCTNPSGANQPAGQNPAKFVVSGSVTIPGSFIKNGNLNFSVTTNAPPTPVPGAPGCPNKNWTETIVDVVFAHPAISVVQGGSTVLSYSGSL